MLFSRRNPSPYPDSLLLMITPYQLQYTPSATTGAAIFHIMDAVFQIRDCYPQARRVLSIIMPSTVVPAKPLPVYYIGHAGVGLLFDDRPVTQSARVNLREIGEEILSLSPRPKAVITFSGHFEAGEIHGPGVIEGEFGSTSCLS